MNVVLTAAYMDGLATCPSCRMVWKPRGDRAFTRGVIVCPRCLRASRLARGRQSLRAFLLPGSSAREPVALRQPTAAREGGER